MDSVTSQIREGKLPEDLLQTIFDDVPYHIIEKRDLTFMCSCSRERIEQAIITLGSDEIRNIIADQGAVDVTCQFCSKNYIFSKEELEQMLTEMQ